MIPQQGNIPSLTDIRITQIGVIHSCFPEKFGIPRQPGMVRSATAQLELLPPYNRREMVRGLEQFSHIWVHFLFHETLVEGWKPTVRPPWLGGTKRLGVFASRTPHRPNHIGLSAVQLDAITLIGGRIVLELSGIDFLDQTPVLDIKPYIPYSDCLPSASCGYAHGRQTDGRVIFATDTELFCQRYLAETGRDIMQLISDLIRHDPRPASQKKHKSRFGMRLWDVNVCWIVLDDCFQVEECRRITVE